MDRVEQASFEQAVDGILAGVRGGPSAAPAGDLDELWAAAVGAGWLEFAEAGALDALMCAVRGTGRVACPLPLADSYVASELLVTANADYAAKVADGTIRPLVVAGPEALGTLDAVVGATHVLELLSSTPGRLFAIAAHSQRRGVAVPPLSGLQLGELVCRVEVTTEQRRHALAVLRLALVARALAAAGRSHELALEHAKTRHQFGRAIGGFGAVQQRTAESHIELSGALMLVEDAVRQRSDGTDEEFLLAVELAVENARSVASHVQFSAQHTLGAIGFFEEHDAPWLFRRVHTDITRTHDIPVDGVADRLLGSWSSLPQVDADAATAQFRVWLRGFLAESGLTRTMPQPHVDDRATVATLAEAGLFGLT